MDMVAEVYQKMNKMPKEELYSLTDQIKRAAVSVPSNIAEGQSRSLKGFYNFLRIAQGSLSELETQLLLTVQLKMLETIDIQTILEKIESIKKQTYSLMANLKTRL